MAYAIFDFQMTPNNLIGEGTKLPDKVNIKQSTIGKHCKISEKVKITNCIIMDHVVIEEG